MFRKASSIACVSGFAPGNSFAWLLSELPLPLIQQSKGVDWCQSLDIQLLQGLDDRGLFDIEKGQLEPL